MSAPPKDFSSGFYVPIYDFSIKLIVTNDMDKWAI